MDHDLQQFKDSPLGRKVGHALTDADSLSRMMVLSQHGLPAIAVLGETSLALDHGMTDPDSRRMVSRWLRELMIQNGFIPTAIMPVSNCGPFNSGVVFAPRASASVKRTVSAVPPSTFRRKEVIG